MSKIGIYSKTSVSQQCRWRATKRVFGADGTESRELVDQDNTLFDLLDRLGKPADAWHYFSDEQGRRFIGGGITVTDGTR